MHLDRCKQLLLNSRSTVKKQLSRLTFLDRQMEKIVHKYDTLALSIITLLREQTNTPNQDRREKLIVKSQQLQKVEEEMDRLGEQKVRLSNSLYCSVSGSCEEVEDCLINQEDVVISKTQQIEEQPQLINLLQECRIGQALNYCLCSKQQKQSALQRGETLILCEGIDCPVRWYHISCVGMTQQSVPENQWLCASCCKKN